MKIINEFVPLSEDIIGQSTIISKKNNHNKKESLCNNEEIMDDVSKVAIMAITSMTNMVKMVGEAIINKINE